MKDKAAGAPTMHIVGLSGGKDSTAMALRLRILRPDLNFTYICTPTGNEPPTMFEHWRQLEDRLESPLHLLGRVKKDGAEEFEMSKVVGISNYDPEQFVTLETLMDKFNALPNNRQRWCTRILKIEPTRWFLGENSPCISYVGLRADEEERLGIYGDIPGVTFSYPMRDEWEWTEPDVWRYLAERKQTIPERTDCEWCYDQRIIDWKRLYLNRIASFMRACGWETKTGRTFRSPTRDTWPAGLVQISNEFDKGRKVRGEDKEASADQQSCRVCRL